MLYIYLKNRLAVKYQLYSLLGEMVSNQLSVQPFWSKPASGEILEVRPTCGLGFSIFFGEPVANPLAKQEISPSRKSRQAGNLAKQEISPNKKSRQAINFSSGVLCFEDRVFPDGFNFSFS